MQYSISFKDTMLSAVGAGGNSPLLSRSMRAECDEGTVGVGAVICGECLCACPCACVSCCCGARVSKAIRTSGYEKQVYGVGVDEK